MDARAQGEGTSPQATTSNHPADLRIRLTCQSVSQFLDRHAADVSRGGIFVRHAEVVPVGCAVKLNLQLSDGALLLAGEGTVFWTRDADPTRQESEPGMGIRFTRLTAESQRMLTFLLAEKAERERLDDGGGFDEDERTVVATEAEMRAAADSGEDARVPSPGPLSSIAAVAAALAPPPAPVPAPAVLLQLPRIVPQPPAASPPPTPAVVIELTASYRKLSFEATRIAADAEVEPQAEPAPIAWGSTRSPSTIADELEQTDLTPKRRWTGRWTRRMGRPRVIGIGAIGVIAGGAAALAFCFALLARPSAKPLPVVPAPAAVTSRPAGNAVIAADQVRSGATAVPVWSTTPAATATPAPQPLGPPAGATQSTPAAHLPAP